MEVKWGQKEREKSRRKVLKTGEENEERDPSLLLLLLPLSASLIFHSILLPPTLLSLSALAASSLSLRLRGSLRLPNPPNQPNPNPPIQCHSEIRAKILLIQCPKNCSKNQSKIEKSSMKFSFVFWLFPPFLLTSFHSSLPFASFLSLSLSLSRFPLLCVPKDLSHFIPPPFSFSSFPRGWLRFFGLLSFSPTFSSSSIPSFLLPFQILKTLFCFLPPSFLPLQSRLIWNGRENSLGNSPQSGAEKREENAA